MVDNYIIKLITMKKVACLRCKGLILEKTAQKYEGYSNYCYKKHLQEQKVTRIIIEKEKSLIDLEIESENSIYELEKSQKESLLLDRIFIEKEENKQNILAVLDQLCVNLLGQSLIEVVI